MGDITEYAVMAVVSFTTLPEKSIRTLVSEPSPMIYYEPGPMNQ